MSKLIPVDEQLRMIWKTILEIIERLDKLEKKQ